MTPREAKRIVMEFWNEDIPGREVTEIKSRDTVMRAVLAADLVGKVQCVKQNGTLYLINMDIARKAEEAEEKNVSTAESNAA